MFWHNYCMVFILVCLQMVSSQVSVSYDSVPIKCGEQLILKCTYTGGVNCCRDSTRLWLINTTQILNDGASTPTGKYMENIDDSNNEFSLKINNIQESDFDKEYKCSYAVTTSQPYRLEKSGDYSCPKPSINVTCWQCAAICLGVGTGIQVPGFFTIIFVLLICCRTTFAWFYAVGVPVVYAILIYIENSLLTIPIGYFECPCRENFTWISFVTLCFATSLIATWIVCYSIFDWIYLHEIFSEKNPKDKIKICCIGYISGGVSFFISSWSNSKWFQGTGSKDAPFKVYVKLGCEAVLKYKDKDVKMQWAKSVVEGWKTIEPFEKKKYKVSATSAFFKKKYHRLHVVGAQPDDEGIYKCTAEPEKEYHFQLILKSHEDCPWKLWLYFGGLMMLIILIFPIPFLSIYYCCWEGDDTSFCKKVLRYSGIVMLTILIFPIPLLIVYFYCLKGGKSQSVESGSSCWPICRVGQDPNTSSSDPEKVRRSPKKERADKKPTDFARSPENERADKKKERKLIEVVRPQPTRPLPPMHLKTDNTGRAEYSTETEIFKPPALPSINKASDSPRPLPQKPPVTQLDPLSDSTSEKKKKKKRKKKEPKQSDEEN